MEVVRDIKEKLYVPSQLTSLLVSDLLVLGFGVWFRLFSGYVAFNIEKTEKDDVDEEPEQSYKLPDGSTISVCWYQLHALG